MKTRFITALILGFSLSIASTQMQEIQAVQQFNTDKYLGTWYEVARLPNFFQKQCIGNISAQYTLSNGGIEVLNKCSKKDGITDAALGFATLENSIGSQLKVSFLPKYLRWIPFTKGDYWVVRIDPEYQVSLVGDPDLKYLWILAREPQIDPMIIQDYLNTAKSFGYTNLDEIIYTKNE